MAGGAGTPWADAVRTGVLDPLGLSSTAPDLQPGDPLAERVATGYTSLSYADARVPVDQVGTAAMAAATGFCSTATTWSATCPRTPSAAEHRRRAAHRLDPPRRQMQHGGWDVEGAPGSSTAWAWA